MSLLETYPDFMLALTVFREAAGEPFEGKVAVARVIINRTTDPRWPNFPDEVVLQPLQFSCYNRGDFTSILFPKRHILADWKAWEDSCRAVEEAQGRDPVAGANHYFNPKIVTPSWVSKMTYVKTIGNHVFYKG